MRTALLLSAIGIARNCKLMALAMALSIATVSIGAVVAAMPRTYDELKADHVAMMTGYVVPMELRPPYPGMETLRRSAHRSPQLIHRIMEVQRRRLGTP